MPRKKMDWSSGVELEDHTRKKHTILREYFRQYLITRCQHPQRERFRLVIIDGFAGGGLYKCGTYGSPLIFIDVLLKTVREINTARAVQGFKRVEIECLIIFNDADTATIELLKHNLAPLLAQATEEQSSTVKIIPEFLNDAFDSAYPKIKDRLTRANCSNVIFNLDQYGYSKAPTHTIRDIMSSWKKAEVILTFMISSLLTYLSPQKDRKAGVPLEPEVQARVDEILQNPSLLAKGEWLGEAEKIVFNHLKGCAPFVSPFSIKNPDGWRYWLMHFANSHRARQVYNDLLHATDSTQGHFGRSGLNMLAYDPHIGQGQLYLFDDNSRKHAIEALHEDIPRVIAESGDVMPVDEFYIAAYSETPAHSDDIHKSIIENREIEVITPNGGKRRQADAITVGDMLKLTSQKNFIFGFSD